MSEESVQEPDVEHPYRRQNPERGAAFDHVELPQQRRDAVAHDPGVEAHADAPVENVPAMVYAAAVNVDSVSRTRPRPVVGVMPPLSVLHMEAKLPARRPHAPGAERRQRPSRGDLARIATTLNNC